jgi:hypothetical protein
VGSASQAHSRAARENKEEETRIVRIGKRAADDNVFHVALYTWSLEISSQSSLRTVVEGGICEHHGSVTCLKRLIMCRDYTAAIFVYTR